MRQEEWCKQLICVLLKNKNKLCNVKCHQWNKLHRKNNLITYLNSDWLIHFQLKPMWVHGKYQSQMKRCIQKVLVFIACDFLSIMKIGEEGRKTFTYACITLLPRIKREISVKPHFLSVAALCKSFSIRL